jgi:membrane protease YdiL (CAAX protease family)
MEIGAGPIVVVSAGFVAVLAAWYLVRARSFSISRTMGATFVVLAALSLASGRVGWDGRIGIARAIAVGLGSGAALYVLTFMFFRVARRWAALRRHTDAVYEYRQGVSPVKTLGVATLVVAPGEELFWRGLVQDVAVAAAGSIPGALVAWGVYVAANIASGSIPIVLGAVVGGAAWATLAWWSGGVAASVASHAVWTALMIARPPQ